MGSWSKPNWLGSVFSRFPKSSKHLRSYSEDSSHISSWWFGEHFRKCPKKMNPDCSDRKMNEHEALCLFQGNWGQFQGNWSQTEIPQYDNAFDPKQLPSRVPPIMGTFDPSHFDPIQGIHIWLILIDPKHGSQIHIHIGPQRFQGEREWRPLLPLLLAAAARAWRPTRPANPMDYRRSVLVNWGYKYIKKIYT